MIKWSSWNLVRTFCTFLTFYLHVQYHIERTNILQGRRDEILDGIRNAVSELQVYQEKFHVCICHSLKFSCDSELSVTSDPGSADNSRETP